MSRNYRKESKRRNRHSDDSDSDDSDASGSGASDRSDDSGIKAGKIAQIGKIAKSEKARGAKKMDASEDGLGETAPLSFEIESVTWNERSRTERDTIELTGTTANRESIKADIPFHQFFRLKLPKDTREDEVEGIVKEIKGQLGWIAKNIVTYKYEQVVPARPFCFGRKEKVLALFFEKIWAYKQVMKKLQNIMSDVEGADEDAMPGTIMMRGKPEPVVMYETDIRPAERFAQTSHLNTTGWVVCKKWIELPTDKDSDIFIPGSVQTDRHIRANHEDVVLEPNEIRAQSIAEYVALIFDIETSSLNVADQDALLYQVSMIFFDSETFSIRPILITWNPHLKELDELTSKMRASLVDAEKYRDIKIQGVEVINCENEKQVLQTFVDIYRKADPSIVVGHNIYGFDMNYLLVRAKVHEIEEFEYLGRTGAKNDAPKKNMNRREVAFHNLPGRLQVDTMFFLMGYDKPQTSYSLESCTEMHLKDIDPALLEKAAAKGELAKVNLLHKSIIQQFGGVPPPCPPAVGGGGEGKGMKGESKGEMKGESKGEMKGESKGEMKGESKEEKAGGCGGDTPPVDINVLPPPSMLTRHKGEIAGEDISKHFHSESYAKRLELGIYCVKDSILTLRLFVERLMFMKLYKMGQASRAPMQVIMTAGSGEKVMPNMLTQMHRQGILYNKYHDISLDPYAELWEWQKYPGGLVRDPKKGKYLTPVTVLDFGGMYPSIMMEHKICTQTMLPTKYLSVEDWLELAKYKHIIKMVHGQEVVIIQGNLDPSTPSNGFSFTIQENMKEWREIAKGNKKKAEASGDKTLEAIYDCEQLAYKIYMNGMYGLYAPVQGGKFTYLLVAAAITQFGREMSHQAGEFVMNCEELRGKNPRMVYGDTDSMMYTHDYPEFKNIPDVLDSEGKVIKKGKTAETQLMEYAFNLNGIIAKKVTASFKSKYILVELEKHYYPMILFDTKKYYCGVKWTGFVKDPATKELVLKEPDRSKPDIVGIEGKKRDRCEHLRELQYRIVNYLVQNRSTDVEIEALIFDALMDIANNRVPLEKLIIVKGLSKSIADYNGKKIPHVAVAEKNEKRGNMDACKKGSRSSYIVFTNAQKYKSTGKGAKGTKHAKWGVSDWAEDAKYAIANKLCPDPRFYIMNHYYRALKKLLAPVNIDIDKLYERPAGIALRTADVGQTSIVDIMPSAKKALPVASINKSRFSLSSTPETKSSINNVKQTQIFFGRAPGPPIFVEPTTGRSKGKGKGGKGGKRKAT